MSSRKISDLNKRLIPKVEEFLSRCHKRGIDVLIYCTYRSPEEQAKLYEQGRTKPGRIVTWAKAYESNHNCCDQLGNPASKAFDCVPLVGGNPQWKADAPEWQTIGEIGESVGLVWAGRWPANKREFPHFELKD